MVALAKLYQDRFETTGVSKRDRVWKVLCEDFFNHRISPEDRVVDLACGYGDFINNVRCAKKLAVDLNPDARHHLNRDVEFTLAPATELGRLGANSADVVFTSNFLEHLKDKEECDAVLSSVFDVLKPGGRFIVMGPNIRFAYREYWDFYDHYLPLSDLSLAEGLRLAGFEIAENIAQFLPFTMNGKTPTRDFLVRLYLKMPLAWKVMGKQFLVTAEKPCS